ncbi:hypothetical protein ACFPRL_33280 [Pseudoclavibacter helvolus]
MRTSALDVPAALASSTAARSFAMTPPGSADGWSAPACRRRPA